jgi:GT2 family glycosyltransferase
MKQPHIAIVILHYKNLHDTIVCISSVQKINYPNYSIIVVNNDTHDHGLKLKQTFEHSIELIQNNNNLGFSEGNNAGIRIALQDDITDAILILNNDTTVDPNFLSEMVIELNKADMIAPRMMQYDENYKIDNLGIVLMKSGLPFNRLSENQKLFCPSAGCALYSRKLLESVVIDDNYFDPAYFAYTEDLDLGWRAKNLGFETGYSKNAIVYHKGSAIHGKLSNFAIYNTYRNLLWTQSKNMPTLLLLRQLPWYVFGWVSLVGFYLLKFKPLIILRALIAGIFNFPDIHNLNKRNVSYKKILSWFEKGLYPRNLK